MKTLRVVIPLLVVFFGAVHRNVAQAPTKPLTNEDVIKMVKAHIPDQTILITIEHGKSAFDTSPDALIVLNQNGVSGAVLNAMLNGSETGTAIAKPTAPTSLGSDCPDKSGVYFQDINGWKPLLQAASAGSSVKSTFGGAKSSVVYIGPTAPVNVPPRATFCFREVKPDLGITIVKLEQKKDHRELQTSNFNAFATSGVGNGVKLKDIIHVTSRPVEGEDDVTLVQTDAPLLPGQYLILQQNPLYANMPASMPMSMRIGIGYDFGVR